MAETNEISPAKRARLQQCFEYGNQKMQIGDHDYATEMFAQCVCGDPSNLIYMQSFVANLRVKFKNKRKKSSFGFMKKATKVSTGKNTKDLDTTIREGVEKLKKDPWDEQTFVSMATACLEEGFDDAGLAYLKLAIDSAPDDPDINRYAAIELGAREQYENAIACWERVLRVNPADVEAGKMISDLMLERTINRVKSAPHGAKEDEEEEEEKLSVEDQCEKRLRKNPNDRDAFVELVDYFFQKGNLRKTEDSCKRALKVFPEDDLFKQKLLEVQRSRASEELKRLRDAYQKDPSDAIKEKFAAQKKIYDEKRLEYIQYRLKKSPNESGLHMELGMFYMERHEFKEAIGELQKAKVDEGIAGQCLLALAECFQHIKQYALAAMHYDQAVAKLDQQSEMMKRALYNGARLALGLNNLEKANEFANRLAAIDFSYKDVGGLLDKIASKLRGG